MSARGVSSSAPVEIAAAPATPRGLVGYSDAIADELFDFQRTAFPERRHDWVVPRWTWMFLSSAARLGVSPMVWLFRGKTGIVAQQGAMAVRAKIGAVERVTGWFVETVALESVRGKSVGPMVIAKAHQDLPFNLSLGQTPDMRKIQFALGWQQVCPLKTYLFVLDAYAVLEARFPNRLLRAAAASALTVAQRAKYWWGRGLRRQAVGVREIGRFDATHTALWNAVKDEYPCAVVRDASYLNWKYVDQPGQRFIRLAIHRGQRLVAIVVLNILEPAEGRPYRRGVLVDLVVRPSDRDDVWTVFDVAQRSLRKRGAHLMAFDLAGDALSDGVASFGFLGGEENRVFLISLGDLPPDLHPLATSPGSWLVTAGDSDIDRPW